MGEKVHRDPGSPKKYSRLFVVFIAAAVAVFGLLYQQMWTHSGGFDYSAFRYWGLRAFGVVIATTIAGILVIKQGWKSRAVFGAVAGLALSFFYVWLTN